MDKQEFKTELERHKNHINASFEFLKKGFKDLQKRYFEFYDFIESNYFDLEERITRLERKVEKLS